MKKIFRTVAALLVCAMLLPLLFGCGGNMADTTEGSNTTEVPEVTEPVLVGEAVEVSAEGKVEWTVLGVNNLTEFAGMTAAEGNVFAVVYLEARNKTAEDTYIISSCLDTGNSKQTKIPAEGMPEGYSEFGGYIASGKRRLFCLCFEKKNNWFNIVMEYIPFYGDNAYLTVKGSEYRENKELLPGNPAYPLDTSGKEKQEADMKTIYQRYVDRYWATPSENNVKKLEATIITTEKGTCFSTVDYESTRTASWPSVSHLTTLKSLVSAYGEERLKTDEKARKNVLDLLSYWLDNDPVSETSWYANEIGVPRSLATVTLLLRPWLTDEMMAKADEIISRGTVKGNKDAVTYTGANLLDMMENTLVHALITEDANMAMAASQRISKELRISKKGTDGMQEDGSFFQHGALLCAAGSYGSVFAEGVADMMYYLHGTVFALRDENVRLFIDHILDGQRYFHRLNGTSYFSIGRTAVYAKGANEMQKAVKMLNKIDGLYRGEEIAEYALSFTDSSKAPAALKYFPISRALVNTSPEYYMAFRGAHSDIILTEVVSGQNVLGYNLSYGSTACYMYYGDEYQDIGAVMDLAMFPGTTAYHETKEQLQARYDTGYNKSWGKDTYTGTHCGGATDSEKGLGALYMELKNDGISGVISYITYKGGTIALGAGLTAQKNINKADIRTVLDQCKLNGAAISGTPLALNGGTAAAEGGVAVTNGAFAYYPLNGSVLTAEAVSLTDSYSRNDPAGSTELVTKDVFQLYISHGTSMANASYAYAVVACPDGKAPASAEELPILSVINTDQIQGVEFKDGSAVIVFHTGGTVTLSSGETVSAEGAEVVIK